MHPMWVVAVPLLLILVGMILNSIGLSFDQPPSSPEEDPIKRLTAEKEAYRRFFDRQRSRAFKRQKRVGQYGWLVLIATVGSFIWLYVDTVNKTALANRVATLRTLGSQEGKDMILSLTLSDGSNVKYVIKRPDPDQFKSIVDAGSEAEKVSSWEMESLATAMSLGAHAMPLGVALRMSP